MQANVQVAWSFHVVVVGPFSFFVSVPLRKGIDCSAASASLHPLRHAAT